MVVTENVVERYV